jgi:hypothetical protein
MKFIGLSVLFSLFICINNFAQITWDGGASTNNWGDALNWSGNAVPTATDSVVLNSGDSVVISVVAVCKSLTCNGKVVFPATAGKTLTISNTLSGTGTIDMSSSSAGILYLKGPNNTIGNFLSGTNSTVSYNGTGTQNIAAWNYYNLTITGAHTTNNVILPTSGEVGIANAFTNSATYTTGSLVTTSSTVHYNGAVAQTIVAIAYNNLTLSIPSGTTASYSKTSGGTLTINGNLVVKSYTSTYTCTFNPAGYNCTVLGTTTVNAFGAITDASATGTNTFTGKVLVDVNGKISESVNSAYIFSGGITNNGKFVLGGTGAKTFSTNSQTIDGTNSVTLGGGAITISGDITITSLDTVSLTGALNGTSSSSIWVNGSGSILNYYSGTVPFSSYGGWDVTTNLNTVNYNGTAQSIKNGTYSSLTFSASGTKALQGTTTVNQTFLMSGSASISCGSYDFSLYGPVTYSSSGTLSTSGTSETVTYNSSSAQDIIPATYTGNLLLQGSGTKTLKGTVTSTTAFTMDANLSCGNFNFTLNGTVTHTSGTLTNGTNTVTYSGSSAQTIIKSAYSTLVLSTTSSAKTLEGNTSVSTAFTLNASSLSCSTNNLTLSGSVTHTAGTFTTGADTVTYNYSSAQSILRGTYGGNLDVSGGLKTLSGAATVSGTFNMNADFACAANNFTLTGPVSYTSGTFSTTGGTLTYSGTSSQNLIAGSIGGSLTISGGDKTLVAAATPLVVAGIYTMGANLNCGNNNATFNGTVTYTSGILTNGSNLVTYGGAAQNLIGATYNKLTISGTGAKTLTAANTFVNDAFTMAVSLACNTRNLKFYGTVTNTGGTITTGADTVTYAGVSLDQNIIPGTYTGLLAFAGSGNRNLIGATIGSLNVTVPTGVIVNTNNYTASLSGNLTIDAGGRFNVNSNTTGSGSLLIASGKTITNNGTFAAIGTSTYPAIVSRYASGTYSIIQSTSSAVFMAKYYQFNYLNGGINISNGSIDPTYNFSNGSFSNGSGSQSLLLTGADLSTLTTVTGVTFNSGPTYNVTRTSGTGAITFADASGTLAGENYDNDDSNPGTLVLWSSPSTTYYSNPNGTFSAGLLTNWTSNADGTGSNPSSLTNGTASLIIQNGHTVTIDATNGSINVKEIQVGQGTSGALVFGSNTTQETLTVQEKMDVKAGATVSAATSGATTHQISLYGNLYNAGTMTLYSPSGYNVNLLVYGTASSIQGSVAPILNNITFKSGSKSDTKVTLDIRGNVVIETTAVFADGGQTLTVAGNWTEAGTGQRTGTGTVIFNGSLNSVVAGTSSTGASFYNVTFQGGSAGAISDVFIVNNNLWITNGTTVQITSNDSIKGNFTVDYGSTFTQTANTSFFKGTSAQSLSGTGTVTFYNLTFLNGGTIPKTLAGTIASTGTISILSGTTTNGDATITAANGIRLDGNCAWTGIVNITGGNIYTYNSSNINTLGSAVLNINGSVGITYVSPATGFQLTVGNNLNLLSGSLYINNGTSIIGNTSYSLNTSSGTYLYLRGSDNFPTGFGSYSLNSGSYTVYDWNIDQVVRGNLNYGNLIIDDNSSSSTWNKSSDGTLNILGSLYLRGATNFVLNGYPLYISGSYIYNGSNSSILGSTSTVTLNATNASQTIQASGTGSYNFQNLIFTLDAPTASVIKYIATGATINLTGDFTVTNINGSTAIQHTVDIADNSIGGSPVNFTLGSNCQLNTTNTLFGANVMDKFTGTKSLDVTSTVYYSLAGAQYIADGFTYGNIKFNTDNKTAEGALDINGNISSNGAVFYDAGYTHTVAGDWSLSQSNYTSASATGTIILDGSNQNISSTNFRNLIVNNTGVATINGNTNIYGDITLNDNSQLDGSGTTRYIYVYGNWYTPGTGKFIQSSGYVYFVGTTNQTFQTNGTSTFYNLTLNKANTAGNQTVTLKSDLVVLGTVTLISSSGVFDISKHTVRIGRNLYVNGNTVETGLTFISDSSTVIFNGALSQSIVNANTNPLTFYNTEFEGAGAKTFTYSSVAGVSTKVNINGSVTITGSSVIANTGYNPNFYVKGDWNNTGTFSHSSGNYVYFNGQDQSISTTTFGCVSFINHGTKTLTGNISASGSLTIADTASLTPNGYNINVAANWIDSSSLAKFNSASETVTFDGSSTSNIYTGTSTGIKTGKSFYNVIVSKSSGVSAILYGDMDVNNDFTLTSGTFTTSTFDMWFAGNFVNSGGTFSHNSNSSLLTFDATSGTKIFNPGSSNTYLRGVTINAPGATYSVANNFTINQNQDFTLTDGYFDLNGHQLQLVTTSQKIVINGGTFDVDAGSTLLFNGTGQSVTNSGGTLKFVGSSTSYATVSKSSGTYTITQTSGNFQAGFYTFNSPGGITISGGTLDATYNFSDGTFSSGTSGTAYLNLNGLNCGDITVSNTVFNSGPTYNVRRTSGNGTITFADASGTLSGETYDDDGGNPGNVIWTNPGGFYWDGGAGTTSWHDAANWSGDVVPDSTNNVYLNHKYVTSAYTVNISAADAKAARLIIDAQSSNAVTLQLQNGYDLKAKGSIVIYTSSNLTVANSNSVIEVGGNWSNAGTFTHGNGTVIFKGDSASLNISSGGTATGKKFYNLEINAPGSIYTLANTTDIDNNFSLKYGTLDAAAAANYMYVGGNWYVDTEDGAVFDPDYSTVYFDGTNQTIENGPFYNFTTAGSGTKSLLSNIAVTGSLTLGSGTTLDAGTNNILVNGNWVNNGGSLTQSGIGTVNFCGTGTQQVDYGTSATTFYNMLFTNGGYKYIDKSISVTGDFNVSYGSGVVDVYTNQITGNGSNALYLGNSTYLRLRGADNFPVNFSTYTLSTTSTVDYYSDLNQTIRVSPNWNYGNLRLFDLTAASDSSIKTAEAGNLTIDGSLTINDIRTKMEMATNSTNMILTGTINFPTGGIQIDWGTGTSTLTHIGTDWYIDPDITGFNNLTLSGSGYKHLGGNLKITGNVIIKNGVIVRMQTGWTTIPVARTMTGLSGKTFMMENGSQLVCPIPDSTSAAFATGFGTYSLGQNSTVTLNSYSDKQLIYTANNIIYGNLNLGGNSRNVTLDGVSDLDVNGYFNAFYATLDDAGKNISVAGSYAYVNFYTPSSTTTFTLDGTGSQLLYDVYSGTSSNNSFDFNNIVFAGSGTKTFGDGNDTININGNLTVGANVTVSTGRIINFYGTKWTNNGYFQHSGNTVTFSNPADQTIKPGVTGSSNYFYNVKFAGTGTKYFKNYGTDINGTFVITDGTVKLSTYDYTMAGSLTNTSGGVLSSDSANITFDGGTQNINTPAFAVNNVTISNSGTKRMFSDWTVNGNLSINNLATLNTSDAVIPTYYNLFVKGNWTNTNSTFTCNTCKVTFNGKTTPISITTNGSNFYDVEFIPTVATQYNLLSSSNRISREMDLRSLASLNLNSNTLILGSNISSGKVYTVEGTLNANANAKLKFNSQTSQSVMNVTGKLNLVGSSSTDIATITRETAGVTGSEAQINILSGGTLAAKYYLIEYLQDAGLIMATGSILDPTYNFSFGRFSNIRNASGVCYLNLEATYTGDTITNINFDYSGTPVQGTHFNVRRNNASTPVIFKNVGGNLGGYKFEDDNETTPAAATGLLHWPAVINTTWIGGISTDWHTAGNWSDGVPTLLIDAIVPTGSPNDAYILNDSAVCKNLNITNGHVYLTNGKKLITSGDIYIGSTGAGILAVGSSSSEITCGGYWTRGSSGMFIHGNGTVRFTSAAGTANITPLTSNFYNVIIDNTNTTFNLIGTPLTIKGSVDVKKGTLAPATNNYVYDVEGDFAVESGDFAPVSGTVTAGTVEFTGSSNQNITNATFYNLTIAGSNNKATHGPITVNNLTTINSVLMAEPGSNIDFNGNVIISSTGTFNDGDETHTFTGQYWTGTGAYSGNGTVVFDRTSSDQYVYASKFANLDIDCKQRNLTFLGDVAITGDAVVRDTVSTVYFNNYLLSSSSSAGTFTVESNSNLVLTGTDVFPSGFTNYDLASNSVTYYRGSSDQTIAGVNYGILTLQNTNTKTLKGDVGVQNTLNFNTSTFDVSSNNYNINISGNWNNSGTGTFVPRAGEVIFEGTSNNQYIYVGTTATNPFWDLTIAKSSGITYAQSSVNYYVNDNLSVTSGTFSANGQSIYVANNMLASGTGAFSQSGTYILTKSSGSATLESNGSTLNNLTIAAGSAATINLADNLRVDANMLVNSGTFNANSKYVQLGYNSNTVSISGKYIAGAGGTLALGYYCSLTVNSGGTIDLVGTVDSPVAVTRNINSYTGSYKFTVDGTIKSLYTLYEYMGGQANGIYITSNGTIDATDNFSYCTFTNGSSTGAMLTIENTQSLTGTGAIINASFPTYPGGSGKNVKKVNATSGTVEFYNASGVFAGQTYEMDSYSLINWTGPLILTWNGSVNTNWFIAGNWTASSGPGFVPTGAENVYIATALNQPIITTYGAKTAHLTINSGATLTLNTPLDYDSTDLTIYGDIIINGTLREVSTSDFLTVVGNWTRNSVTQLLGNVTFNGTGSAKIINNGNYPFYNLIIAGTCPYRIVSGSYINGSLTINSGASLTAYANSYLYLGGNWTNSGTYTASTGKVILNGSGTQYLNGGSSAFYDLDINSGVTAALSGTTSISRTLNIYGNLSIAGQTLNVGDNSGVDYLNVNGTLNIGANAYVLMGASSFFEVNSGGILNIIGSDENNPAYVSNQSGTYSLDILSGGTLAAKYFDISYTGINGLYMHSGAVLDTATKKGLWYGAFSNGASGGQYLKFENEFGADITIGEIQFNNGPLYNISRTSGTNIITIQDASGDLGTFEYENDANGITDANSGLLIWTYQNTYIWTGAVNHNWHVAGNWMTNLIPDITKSAIIPNVTNYPQITAASAVSKKLTLYKNARIEISDSLTLASDVVNGGTIVAIGSPLITVGGSWTGSKGVFTPATSNVILNAVSGTKPIFFKSGSFYDLTINAVTGVIYTLDTLINIGHNLTLNTGTLDASKYNLTVGGSWVATGTFVPGTKKVTLNASSGTNTFKNGTNSFYDLLVYSGNGSGTATFTLGSALNVTHNFTLTKGTLDASSDGGTTVYSTTIGNRSIINGGAFLARSSTINVGENWQVSSPGVFTCGTSTVIVKSATGTKSITPGTSAFYNLTVNSGGTYRISYNTMVNNNLTISAGTLDVSSSPSYNITVSGNWTNNGSFVPRTGTVTFNGTNQALTNASGELFYNLTVSNSTAIALNNNMGVSNTFTFTSGTITTGSNVLTVGTGTSVPGTLSYTAGTIIGNYEKWIAATGSYLFPVGTNTNTQLATVTINSGLTAGSLRMRYVATDAGGTGLPLTETGRIITNEFPEGYWDATARNSFAATNYNLALKANGFSTYYFGSNTAIIKRTNGGSWFFDGTHAAASSPNVYRNNLTGGISTSGTQFCIGFPDCQGGAIASDQSVCKGSDVPAFTNITSPSGGSNSYTYTWQYTTNTSAVAGDANWTDISSSNAVTYDYGNLSQSTRFIRKISGTGCTSDKYSNIITITVLKLPVTGQMFRVPNM